MIGYGGGGGEAKEEEEEEQQQQKEEQKEEDLCKANAMNEVNAERDRAILS